MMEMSTIVRTQQSHLQSQAQPVPSLQPQRLLQLQPQPHFQGQISPKESPVNVVSSTPTSVIRISPNLLATSQSHTPISTAGTITWKMQGPSPPSIPQEPEEQARIVVGSAPSHLPHPQTSYILQQALTSADVSWFNFYWVHHSYSVKKHLNKFYIYSKNT